MHFLVCLTPTVDLNPANWAASVAQLAEYWTSNPVVTGSNPVRGSSVLFSLSAFRLCLILSCLPLHIHVEDLIMCMYMYVRVAKDIHIYMYMYMYMNNHVHSAPQSKKEENRKERKKNHATHVHTYLGGWCHWWFNHPGRLLQAKLHVHAHVNSPMFIKWYRVLALSCIA